MSAAVNFCARAAPVASASAALPDSVRVASMSEASSFSSSSSCRLPIFTSVQEKLPYQSA